MPTTVVSSSGTIFHLFQGQCFVRESTSSIEFSELENDLGDSFLSKRLYGSNTGNRSWMLTMPSLSSSMAAGNTVTGINGETVTKETYIWDLFCETKSTGKPFAYQDPRNGQYYLVDFADKKLSLQRMLAKLYSTGIEIKQRRMNGETVFDLAQSATYNGGTAGSEWYKQTTHNSPSWRQVFFSGLSSAAQFDGTNCTFAANPQNGLNTVRLTAASGSFMDHNKLGAPNAVTIYDMLMVMKIRVNTFTNNNALVYDGAANVLQGTSGSALFTNLSLSDFEYRFNGIAFPQTAMTAPMNKWGVVHLRFTNSLGKTMSAMRIGTGTDIDIGEIRLTNVLTPMSEIREYVEHLQVKWNTGG